jgi:hypothetical protein
MKFALSSRSAPPSALVKRARSRRKYRLRSKWLVLGLVNLAIWIVLIIGLIQRLT